MDSVRNATFDPRAAMIDLMHTDQTAIRKVQSKITTEALNVNKNKVQYSNLVSLDNRSENEKYAQPTRLPRAKKNAGVSKLRQDGKPSADELCQPEEDVDTVSLSYPKLADGPLSATSYSAQATVISNRSNWNIDAMQLWLAVEEPVRCEDVVGAHTRRSRR
ncbi:hypothetical protein HDV00_003676 [Rhizophlyctis rosea]|nr:hypothetical protein HDV00_003676 [Rhizophlyctis rosea]